MYEQDIYYKPVNVKSYNKTIWVAGIFKANPPCVIKNRVLRDSCFISVFLEYDNGSAIHLGINPVFTKPFFTTQPLFVILLHLRYARLNRK